MKSSLPVWLRLWLRRPGIAQQNELLAIYQALKGHSRQSTMIDVGAHNGGSLLPFAKRGWRVVAFEPDPANRAALEQRSSGLTTVTIDTRAVGAAAADEVAFFASDVSTGISSLSAFHESHEQVAKVAVTTLAQAFQEHDVEEVCFLKIDAEGHDLMVLQGVPWETVTPEVILCEFENSKTQALGYDFDDMASYLRDLGFDVLVSEWYPIERYAGKHRWRSLRPYPCDLTDPEGWGNLIASKNPSLLRTISDIINRG